MPTITRRNLLTATGAGAAALLLDRAHAGAQAPSGRPIVFSHTTVVTVDAVRDDVALAVEGDRIAAIGPTDEVLRTRPNAEVHEDATLGGAHALGQRARIGSLEVGKKADLLVVDTRRAHLVPAGRIVSAWIHNGQPADVESVLIDGQFVMRDRKVLTLDEDRIVADADRVGRRVWSQVNAAGPIAIPGRPRA